MQEQWKDVKGFEGLYQISNHGRVKSVQREVAHSRKGCTKVLKEKMMSICDNGNGYKTVYFLKNGKRSMRYIHRLVAEHFIEKPLGKEYVNHKDYDTGNNRVDNLEWCSQSENIQHSVERMRKERQRCKRTNTGEKYISNRKLHGKYEYYILTIRKKGIVKCFKSLSDAVEYRDKILKGVV